MGKTIVRQGGPGAGQHTKMVNQMLIATGMIGVCEALLYGYRAGLDLDDGARVRRRRRRRLVVADELRPAHARRRLRAGLLRRALRQGHGHRARRGEAGKLALPGLALAEQLYVALQAQGHGRKGTHSLILALASLSDIDWEQR